MATELKFSDFKFIDMHYHASPDLYSRKYDFITAARKYKAIDGAVILRSHLGSTSIQATIAQSMGLPVFPSVNLNNINNGVCYKSVIRALAEYQPVLPTKIIVDLPTITKTNHISQLSRNIIYPEFANVLNLTESIYGKCINLKKSLVDIFKMSKGYPIVISTGHCSGQEIKDILKLAEKLDMKDLLLNQPHNPITNLNNHQLQEIVKQYPFVYIEQTALTYLLGYQQQNDFYQSLINTPNLLYSSDLGQTSQIDIMKWWEHSDKWFNEINLPLHRKQTICLTNPLKLIQI